MGPSDTEADGLRTIEGDFYTENLVVRGELISSDLRLSDHLNGSTATFELRPSLVLRGRPELRVNISDGLAYIAKDHLLFVIPLREPPNEDVDAISGRTQTLTHTCWASLGHYSVMGKVHMDSSRDPRLFLRSLQQRRFLPFTNASITFPDGSLKSYEAVIVNRAHVELMAIQPDAPLTPPPLSTIHTVPDSISTNGS